MERKDAKYFASQMEGILDIPAFMCEAIEEALVNGDFKSVCNFILGRLREIEGDADD